MARYIAAFKFSTVLQIDGRNLLLAADKGDTLELSGPEHAALEADLPGAVGLPPAPKKPATKKGVTKSSRTRQVTKGANR